MKEELETGKGKDMVRLTKKEVHKEKEGENGDGMQERNNWSI